jgi:hypothetical protein
MERRSFLELFTGGAVGTMIGYYLGASELLGLQSERTVVERPPDRPEPTPQPTEAPNTPLPETETPTRTSGASTEGFSIYDAFEDGDLGSPGWRAYGLGSGGLAPQNEIGITNTAHSGNYALYLDQGGSISNFAARSELEKITAPEKIVFWIQPAGKDQYTKNNLSLINDGTLVVEFLNHIQNDGLYFRFGETNNESDRKRIRDGAITTSTEQFVEVRLEQINWENATIGRVYVDGELTATGAPFVNQADGFDTIHFEAIGGGGTVFYVDDIGWE